MNKVETVNRDRKFKKVVNKKSRVLSRALNRAEEHKNFLWQNSTTEVFGSLLDQTEKESANSKKREVEFIQSEEQNELNKNRK